MAGSYSKILRRCTDYLPNAEVSAICPNWQSYVESKLELRYTNIHYLYNEFNEAFDDINVSKLCLRFPKINFYEILLVDKTHFKKKSGEYQLRYICTIAKKLIEIYDETKPDFLFFPNIETIDSMMAYKLAQALGIEPIIYAHTRFTNLSFYSSSHFEILPPYYRKIKDDIDDQMWSKKFIDEFSLNPKQFKISPIYDGGEVYENIRDNKSTLYRFFRNVWLKLILEKHNQNIKFSISFQIRFQKIFTPLRNITFRLTEFFVIKPKRIPKGPYDYFPLHFSPESSINVPAPFYIDQVRVVDKIMLERNCSIPLIIKEHPAMYGFRPKGFYASLLNRPMVHFVHRNTKSYELIKNAKTVYSVTGTACFEAFFLNVNWVQFGKNFLSDWMTSQKNLGLECTPDKFINDVRKVSGDFILYSPGISDYSDKVLFAKENIKNLTEHMIFHINHLDKLSLDAIPRD